MIFLKDYYMNQHSRHQGGLQAFGRKAVVQKFHVRHDHAIKVHQIRHASARNSAKKKMLQIVSCLDSLVDLKWKFKANGILFPNRRATDFWLFCNAKKESLTVALSRNSPRLQEIWVKTWDTGLAFLERRMDFHSDTPARRIPQWHDSSHSLVWHFTGNGRNPTEISRFNSFSIQYLEALCVAVFACMLSRLRQLNPWAKDPFSKTEMLGCLLPHIIKMLTYHDVSIKMQSI